MPGGHRPNRQGFVWQSRAAGQEDGCHDDNHQKTRLDQAQDGQPNSMSSKRV
jgi:hypothetical protein